MQQTKVGKKLKVLQYLKYLGKRLGQYLYKVEDTKPKVRGTIQPLMSQWLTDHPN